MASWMVHLRIADAICSCGIIQRDKDAFIIGNIAPDSGRLNSDKLTYTPSKEQTHFQKRQELPDADRFYSEYVINADDCDSAFLRGYYSHLLTDRLWITNIARPLFERYSAELERDKLFLYQFKHDWYDLDKLFLAENPDFQAMKVTKEHRSCTYSALPFLAPDMICDTINRICDFYSIPYERDADDLYRYTTKAVMDLFVSEAVSEIKQKLLAESFV